MEERDDLATRDALSGVHNRRHLQDEIASVVPDDALVLVDLDNLKRVNDAYGHAAGDDTIRSFGSHLMSLAGAGVYAARVGGDEFALIVRGSDPGRARFLIDGLREQWNESNPVTFSAGVANAADGYEDTFENAGRALNDAMSAGGNRTVVFGEPGAPDSGVS